MCQTLSKQLENEGISSLNRETELSIVKFSFITKCIACYKVFRQECNTNKTDVE
jgi:hypothetical protein